MGATPPHAATPVLNAATTAGATARLLQGDPLDDGGAGTVAGRWRSDGRGDTDRSGGAGRSSAAARRPDRRARCRPAAPPAAASAAAAGAAGHVRRQARRLG